MTLVPINWEQAKTEFWEKLVRNAPRTKKATDLIDNLFGRIWKDVRPLPGIEETIEINVDKSDRLTTSLSGWVLLGATALAAANIALEEMDKSAHFQELSKKVKDLQSELDDLKAKVKRIEEYKEIA